MTRYIGKNLFILTAILTLASMVHSKSLASSIKEETVTYKSGGISLKGFVAYDESIKGKRPVILIVHEWWGLNDYARMRARMLAELGYFAMAVDMFGDGKTAANPKEAQEFTSPFYKDPKMARVLLDAAILKIAGYPQVDPASIAAIGYCFGGFIVLNAAKLGAPLKGVVSFHGGLGGLPADKKLLQSKILVCHGGSDKFVPQHDIDALKHSLDSIGADYTIKVYAGATHAFTNPDATKNGKEFNLPIEYNAVADKASWNDMKVFLGRIFVKGGTRP